MTTFKLTFVLLLLVHCTCCLGNETYLNSTTVRASTCISNSTHCHCTLHTASANSICIKPVAGDSTRCTKGRCAAGYHCDCDSSTICAKVSAIQYTADKDSSADEFDCSQGHVTVPRNVVGNTTDLHIVAYQGFQLFINSEQIGFSTTADYKVFTAEVQKGDVVAVIAKRKSAEVYGLKLRFIDLQNETRYVDENWYCTDTYISSWLSSSFDPTTVGWSHPSISSTISDASFDADVPWMWYGTSETVYFRYTIP